LPSIRSISHAITDRPRRRGGQRGFVLIAALILAVLYFALMELMLIDASQSLEGARRFRARVVAVSLAENAVELAAVQMVSKAARNATAQNADGQMHGNYTPGDTFELFGDGMTSGVINTPSRVQIEGKVEGTTITIEWARYAP
jgi:Tfp pilus assembly protein PilX